jgi:hypothetical protein
MLYRSSHVFAVPILILVSIATATPCIADKPYIDPLAEVWDELVPLPAEQALADIPDLGRKLLARRIDAVTAVELDRRRDQGFPSIC